MTNAEKYLKDGEEAKEIWHKYQEFLMNNDKTENACTFVEFMKEQSKPTLTEDERVILRNLQNVRYIGRTSGSGYLYATFNTIDNYSNRNDITDIDLYFGDLFQFIKERRRIFNRGVVKK